MFNIIKLNEKDNIGIAPMNIPRNVQLNIGIKTKTDIPYGHKISLVKIKTGEFILRYGQKIGVALVDIDAGEHVHSHNLSFSEFKRDYKNNFVKENYINNKNNIFFKGYKRSNGSAGTRNYIGLISTVNCSATVVKKNS